MFNQIIKTMKRVILFSAFFLGLFSLATAQQTPGNRHQQKHQFVGITHGIKNGELTRPEATRLKQEQKHIQHEKRLAKADGKVTPRERKQIRRDLRIANRNIYRRKHNKHDRN
jgi:hypothetical protein